MIAKFLIWTYRHDYKELWTRKYQWYYLGITSAIFFPLAINRFGYWIFDKTTTIEIIYWLSLVLINLNSVYLLVDVKYGKKLIEKYYQKLLTYDKVICCWEDKDLQKGQVYEIQDNFGRKQIKNTSFWISQYNYKIFKLVSLKEQRKLKLEKLGI